MTEISIPKQIQPHCHYAHLQTCIDDRYNTFPGIYKEESDLFTDRSPVPVLWLGSGRLQIDIFIKPGNTYLLNR